VEGIPCPEKISYSCVGDTLGHIEKISFSLQGYLRVGYLIDFPNRGYLAQKNIKFLCGGYLTQKN